MHFALIAFCGYLVFCTIVYTLLKTYARAAHRSDDVERQRSLRQGRHNPQYGSTAITHSGGAATRVDQPCGQPQSLQAAPSNQTVQPYKKTRTSERTQSYQGSRPYLTSPSSQSAQPYQVAAPYQAQRVSQTTVSDQTTQSSGGTHRYNAVQPQRATQLEQSRRFPDARGQRTGPLDATAHSRVPSVPSQIHQAQPAQKTHCSLYDVDESSRQEAIIHQSQHGGCVAHSPTHDLQLSNANKKSPDVASISDTESVATVSISQLRLEYESAEKIRAEARRERSKKIKCQKDSAACATRNPLQAHRLAENARAHERQEKRLNARARRWIFADHNEGSPVDRLDLHWLHVGEAVASTDKAVAKARKCGVQELIIIVGKGQHSAGGVAKVKPAIQAHLEKLGLVYRHPKYNTGAFIVKLSD